MDQREERTKNFLLPESHFRGEKSLLFILRQWNSYTPILVEDQEYDRGGGYFIYHCNSEQQKIGLVIDPGYNFIENFHRACCRIHDITHIAITHAHDDHTAQLEQLFTLLYQYNSKNNNQDSPRKQITLLLNHSVLKKFSGFDMYKESPYIKEVITLNAFDEENHQRIALSKDFFLTVLPAYHNDIYSRHYAVGFGIEIGEMNNFKKIIFTGDTGLFPPLDRSAESKNNRYSGKYKDTLKVDEREGKEVYLHYPNTFKKNPDLLIPHIGSIQKYEFKPRSTVDIPMFYPNHLGLLGTALLINHIWPKAVILSEFGAELRDIRAEMTQILQQSLSAATCATKMADSAKKVSVPHEETEYDQNSSCETRTKPFIFPGDPTIVYNIKNGKFLCHGDGSFLPPEYLEFKDVDGGHIGLFQKGKPCATIQPFFKALDNKRHNSSEAVCGISLNYFTD